MCTVREEVPLTLKRSSPIEGKAQIDRGPLSDTYAELLFQLKCLKPAVYSN